MLWLLSHPRPYPPLPSASCLSVSVFLCVAQRARKGWPPLTAEDGVNGDSKSTNEKGSFPWLFHWACRAGTRGFCFALAALIGQFKISHSVQFQFQLIFCTLFQCPIAQQAGHGQAAVLGRLSLGKSQIILYGQKAWSCINHSILSWWPTLE
jgi:hypothetical protein